MAIAAPFNHTLNALISVCLAPPCAACRAILDTPLDGCVCRNCWEAIQVITPPVCDGCGDPLAAPISPWCLRCNREPRIIRRSRAVGAYEGALREILHAFKYGRRRSLAGGLGELMRVRGYEILDEADFVVPVPLHQRRERSRGFNQARELARHLRVPVIDALVRIRQTSPQVELHADKRHANVRGAFAMRRRWARTRLRWCDATVVLVDDVSTTGATLNACATVLKEVGTREVYALTAARVVTASR